MSVFFDKLKERLKYYEELDRFLRPYIAELDRAMQEFKKKKYNPCFAVAHIGRNYIKLDNTYKVYGTDVYTIFKLPAWPLLPYYVVVERTPVGLKIISRDEDDLKKLIREAKKRNDKEKAFEYELLRLVIEKLKVA